MDALRWLLAIALILAPLAWYLWRESRDRKPSVLWPDMAKALRLAFTDEPPMIKGAWSGRDVTLLIDNGKPVASARYQSASRGRLEVGEREQIEQSSGIVVPDRVEFPEDGEFSKRFLVRATPEEFGRLALDPTTRRRLLGMPGLHILGTAGRVDVTVPELREEAQFRDVFDVAVTVAAAAEQT